MTFLAAFWGQFVTFLAAFWDKFVVVFVPKFSSFVVLIIYDITESLVSTYLLGMFHISSSLE